MRLWHQLNVLCTLNSRPVPRGFGLRIFNILANFKKLYNIIQTGVYMFKVSYRKTLEQDLKYVQVQRPIEQRTKVKNPSLTRHLTTFSS